MKISRILTAIAFSTVMLLNAPAQSSRPMIEDISTRSEGGEITVSWTLPKEESLSSVKAFNIYRSHQPLTSGNQLTNQQLCTVVPADVSSWTDEDPGLLTWYYAVTAVYNDGNIYDILIPTVNTTVYAAGAVSPQKDETQTAVSGPVVMEPVSTAGAIRERPLPYLQIFKDDVYDISEISPFTIEEAAGFGINSVRHEQVKPYVFDEDTDENVTGDSYTLYYIVATCFERNDWKASETELNKFLQTNKSSYITAKAQIYLGQSYYFQARYREALRHFMLAENTYPDLSPLTKRWIQYSLDSFILPDDAQHPD